MSNVDGKPHISDEQTIRQMDFDQACETFVAAEKKRPRTPDAKGSRRSRAATPVAHEQVSVLINGRSIVAAYTKRRLQRNFSNSPRTG